TLFCFFFQAEDGIRDKLVTGVQTCALPISGRYDRSVPRLRRAGGADRILGRYGGAHREDRSAQRRHDHRAAARRRLPRHPLRDRSEERRVGKEGRWRGWTEEEKERGGVFDG